jgi:hypothetical protein
MNKSSPRRPLDQNQPSRAPSATPPPPAVSTNSESATDSKLPFDPILNMPKPPEGTTAFELASLAATLAQQPGSSRTPQECLGDALKLLIDAQRKLDGRLTEALAAIRGVTRYSFSYLLEPISDQPTDNAKKRLTRLGTITTEQGLKKAIRRVFRPPESEIIISRKEFQYADLHYFLTIRAAPCDPYFVVLMASATGDDEQITLQNQGAEVSDVKVEIVKGPEGATAHMSPSEFIAAKQETKLTVRNFGVNPLSAQRHPEMRLRVDFTDRLRRRRSKSYVLPAGVIALREVKD